MAKPRALILGGAGYFGSRLSEHLSKTHDVTVTYRSLLPHREAWLNASDLGRLHYDAATSSSIDMDESVDLLINLAMPGAREAARDTDAALAAAEHTAKLCCKLVSQGRAHRLIHLSTFHVYGENGGTNYCEDSLVAPKHPYGQIHHAVERRLLTSECADKIYILRATNMAGAPAHLDLGDQAGLVFLDLCRQSVCDGRITLGNDGSSYRDILPFKDAIDGVMLIAGCSENTPNVFNMAAGQSITLRTLAEAIASEAECKVEIEYGAGRDAFRESFQVDISRLKEIGWRPYRDLADEIAATFMVFR